MTDIRQRLAAILAADAAGYSRLMTLDETGTVTALDAARGVFRAEIEAHHGRVVDMAGDSVLAVFDTAGGAVSAALAVQKQLQANGHAAPADRALMFRIGVHLGDVIEKADGTVYGDGVNIAARLESLAKPGGVSVSEAVYCAVRDRMDATFCDQGERAVKNIAKPVRAFFVSCGAAQPGPAPAPAAMHEREVKPAIAVLPLNNMSGDPEQEFFADGITEDIITELSRFKELFVISRNSSFKFKGKPVDVHRFAQELGVQYVLEGSVRKAGHRVRITVQLIDALTDHHIWAERYDRDLEDVFAIQDEVTSAIVSVLPRRVEAAARDRAARETPDNMAAYECVLTAKVLHHRSRREDNARALQLLERAIALAPNYAHARAWRACTLGQAWSYGWLGDEVLETLSNELQSALALDDNDSDTHRILAALGLTQNDFDAAMRHQQRALTLNPNDDLVVVQQGEILTWIGRAEEGIEWIRKAMRLNPYHPERFWNHLGRAYFVARRYGEALEAFNRLSVPDATQHGFIAACHARLGDATSVAAHVKAVLAAAPGFRIDEHLATLHYRNDADREHHRDGLLAAGFAA